jgi:hypothetical protein
MGKIVFAVYKSFENKEEELLALVKIDCITSKQ